MTTTRVLNICFGSTNPNQPDKKFYSQHGVLIFGTNDQGEERISLKLSSLPISEEFKGWFSVFPPRDDKSKGVEDVNDDHIPF
jgi:hypothetical protein